MSMTRLTVVYTLNPNANEHDAIEALRKTEADLPEGAVQNLCRRNEQGMDIKIRWVPFGDLVQFIDFAHGWQAQQFDTSEAYHKQEARCKGMFSNIAFLSCTLIDELDAKTAQLEQKRKQTS
jgi:hypothetical protein